MGHLGQKDESLASAREALGPGAIIGRTCHDSTKLMERAVREGATYCAFGRLFKSETKPTASGLSLAKLSELVAACPVPVVAIGGINADNATQVLDTGVSMLAVSGAVFKRNTSGRRRAVFLNYFKERMSKNQNNSTEELVNP